jgi:trehalose 6-phosphate phosphatase
MPELPSALDQWGNIGDNITSQLKGKRLAVFLDYDGTLTPIAARPEMAVLAEEMRETVRSLAELCPVAIVSGRDRLDVEQLVQIESLIYAGSHGFDIAGPEGGEIEFEQGSSFLASLDQAEQAFSQELSAVTGARIERKKFSIAVHFRGVARQDEARVEPIVDAVLARSPDLRKGLGKKVFELQPGIDWHKGKAVLWLLEALGLNADDVVPVYVGDDVTDEDAFRALASQTQHGIGIVVTETPRPTAAQYSLKSTDEVQTFLHQLSAMLRVTAQ